MVKWQNIPSGWGELNSVGQQCEIRCLFLQVCAQRSISDNDASNRDRGFFADRRQHLKKTIKSLFAGKSAHPKHSETLAVNSRSMSEPGRIDHVGQVN